MDDAPFTMVVFSEFECPFCRKFAATSDVLLEKFPDESSLIRHIPPAKIDQFMAVAEDRMKKKVMGAQEALAQGIGRVVFADGRVEQPVRRALAGEGTVIGE